MIIEEPSPMIAKRKSRTYRDQTRGDWDLLRHKVMRWCLRVKLAQNYEEFGKLLLSTENRPIVEQSSKDDFWGAYVRGKEVLVGQNVLGRLLMELRTRLQSDQDEKLKVVDPLPVPDFLFLGSPIETVEVFSREEVCVQRVLC